MVIEKWKIFQVREKSGIFALKIVRKVREVWIFRPKSEQVKFVSASFEAVRFI